MVRISSLYERIVSKTNILSNTPRFQPELDTTFSAMHKNFLSRIPSNVGHWNDSGFIQKRSVSQKFPHNIIKIKPKPETVSTSPHHPSNYRRAPQIITSKKLKHCPIRSIKQEEIEMSRDVAWVRQVGQGLGVRARGGETRKGGLSLLPGQTSFDLSVHCFEPQTDRSKSWRWRETDSYRGWCLGGFWGLRGRFELQTQRRCCCRAAATRHGALRLTHAREAVQGTVYVTWIY